MNVQVVSDQKLLNCYLSGDRNAISQLIERHSRRVRDYIQMMVKDGDVADDIFQETFIKAVRVIDEGRYTDNGRFLSVVLRIAHNQVSTTSAPRNRTGSSTRPKPVTTYWVRCGWRNAPSKTKSSASRSPAMSAAWWSCCPTSSAEVVMMRYYSGLSFKEIAEQAGVSINTALGRMRYALINLRKMIKEKNLILS